MSEAIQRYDLEQGSGWDSGGAMLLEAVDGDWIKYEAFAKMEAERDDFERKGKELCTAYGNSLITINDLEKKLKRMQAPVSEEEIRLHMNRDSWGVTCWYAHEVNDLLAARTTAPQSKEEEASNGDN